MRDLNVGTSRERDLDVEGKKTQCLRVNRGEKSKVASHSKTATYHTVSLQFIGGQKLMPQNVPSIDEEEASC